MNKVELYYISKGVISHEQLVVLKNDITLYQRIQNKAVIVLVFKGIVTSLDTIRLHTADTFEQLRAFLEHSHLLDESALESVRGCSLDMLLTMMALDSIDPGSVHKIVALGLNEATCKLLTHVTKQNFYSFLSLLECSPYIRSHLSSETLSANDVLCLSRAALYNPFLHYLIQHQYISYDEIITVEKGCRSNEDIRLLDLRQLSKRYSLNLELVHLYSDELASLSPKSLQQFKVVTALPKEIARIMLPEGSNLKEVMSHFVEIDLQASSLLLLLKSNIVTMTLKAGLVDLPVFISVAMKSREYGWKALVNLLPFSPELMAVLKICLSEEKECDRLDLLEYMLERAKVEELRDQSVSGDFISIIAALTEKIFGGGIAITQSEKIYIKSLLSQFVGAHLADNLHKKFLFSSLYKAWTPYLTPRAKMVMDPEPVKRFFVMFESGTLTIEQMLRPVYQCFLLNSSENPNHLKLLYKNLYNLLVKESDDPRLPSVLKKYYLTDYVWNDRGDTLFSLVTSDHELSCEKVEECIKVLHASIEAYKNEYAKKQLNAPFHLISNKGAPSTLPELADDRPPYLPVITAPAYRLLLNKIERLSLWVRHEPKFSVETQTKLYNAIYRVDGHTYSYTTFTLSALDNVVSLLEDFKRVIDSLNLEHVSLSEESLGQMGLCHSGMKQALNDFLLELNNNVYNKLKKLCADTLLHFVRKEISADVPAGSEVHLLADVVLEHLACTTEDLPGRDQYRLLINAQIIRSVAEVVLSFGAHIYASVSAASIVPFKKNKSYIFPRDMQKIQDFLSGLKSHGAFSVIQDKYAVESETDYIGQVIALRAVSNLSEEKAVAFIDKICICGEEQVLKIDSDRLQNTLDLITLCLPKPDPAEPSVEQECALREKIWHCLNRHPDKYSGDDIRFWSKLITSVDGSALVSMVLRKKTALEISRVPLDALFYTPSLEIPCLFERMACNSVFANEYLLSRELDSTAVLQEKIVDILKTKKAPFFKQILDIIFKPGAVLFSYSVLIVLSPGLKERLPKLSNRLSVSKRISCGETLMGVLGPLVKSRTEHNSWNHFFISLMAQFQKYKAWRAYWIVAGYVRGFDFSIERLLNDSDMLVGLNDPEAFSSFLKLCFKRELSVDSVLKSATLVKEAGIHCDAISAFIEQMKGINYDVSSSPSRPAVGLFHEDVSDTASAGVPSGGAFACGGSACSTQGMV